MAGGVALALAAAVLLATAGRAIAGRRVVSMLVLGALLALSLGATGLAGIVASPQLHAAQAQAFEHDRQWQAAMAEYARAGERAPNAPDIARVLVTAGNEQLQAGDYAGALAQFTMVLTRYGQSGAAVVDAEGSTFATYSAWVQSTRDDVPYTDAITYFSQYRSGSPIEAQARYQYGAALARQKQYSEAIEQFETVTAAFADSSFAAQAHTAAATAYLALGRLQLAEECSTAVPTYQKLATTYGDTPEGKQAKVALAARQTVTGHMYHAPTTPAPIVFLSKRINPDATVFSNEYRALFNAKTGLFIFHNVTQGPYYVDTRRDGAAFIYYSWLVDPDSKKPLAFRVGPLCPTDIGYWFYHEG
jgi:tetratricopeptide (TPR) repeat protein